MLNLKDMSDNEDTFRQNRDRKEIVLKKKIILSIFSTIFLVLSFLFYDICFGRYIVNIPMRDIEYKKAIIKDSNNLLYRLENLRPVVGEEELTEFIKNNNDNPEIYTPSKENINNGVFRANLHMHTLNSDGKASVKERLDEAQQYAQNNIKNGYMYIAITDHNTINGAKEVVEVLQKNPHQYPNIKVILGMEVFSEFKSKYYSKPVQIHVLNWCLNPYDKFLNKEFYKAPNANKWNRYGKDRDFDKLIPMMSKYAITGIAHPIRYTTRIGKNKHLYMEEMLDRYSKLSTKPLFAEGYYQAYPRFYSHEKLKNVIIPYSDYVNKKLGEKNIIRTGSTDSHSKTIFD